MADNETNENKEVKKKTGKNKVVEKKNSNLEESNPKVEKPKTNKKGKNTPNNRLADVIEKMEEETQKVQAKEKVKAKEKIKENENVKEQAKKNVEENKKVKSQENKKVEENKKVKPQAKKKQEESKKEKAQTTQKNKSSKNIEENKALKVSKNQKNKISTQVKELETIEEEIKKQTVIPKEKMKKIYKKVFENILYAIIILIYFILINIGCKLLEQNIFVMGLKICSIASIIITIGVFEYAYKKESGKYTIHGIELLILSICTLMSRRIYKIYNRKFISAMASIALLFAIYYVSRAIIIYVKEKAKAKKTTNDIFKISKKEEK